MGGARRLRRGGRARWRAAGPRRRPGEGRDDDARDEPHPRCRPRRGGDRGPGPGRGQLTVADPATGYHRALYAPCPADGQAAGVWRVVKEHGGAITQVTMRCARCGGDFVAAPEALYLR